MHWDLPGFLEQVAVQQPDWLKRIELPVDSNNHEVAALTKNMYDAGQQHMLLFENLTNVAGNRSPFPLLFNTFGERSFIAQALGLPTTSWREELVAEFARLQQTPGRVAAVPRGRSPCQEEVLRGADVDVRQLPAPVYHTEDVGPYFVMACILKSPSGFYDATFAKNLILGPDLLSITAIPHHHHWLMIKEYEAHGQPAPVVIVLAHHPAFFLGTCALTPYGHDDYPTIAGFMGGEIRLTPSVTWGENFLVPADAEVIIEGEILPGERVWQNPFGEVTGHYQERMEVPAVRVRAITHRRGAIVQGLFPGEREHFHLNAVPKEGGVIEAIRRVVPGVRAVHLPPSGCGCFSGYISLAKRDHTDVARAAMQAYCEVQNLRLCVLVDPDVDVFNEEEVLWAVATQARWEDGFQLFQRIQVFRKYLGYHGAVIDATRPNDPDFPRRNSIPAEALARMDPGQYLGKLAGVF